MELTEEQAVDITIELWTWLHKTGERYKHSWKGWKKYGKMDANCPLCKYHHHEAAKADTSSVCIYCPYKITYGYICMDSRSPYARWVNCHTVLGRKRLAGKFLKQLLEIKAKYG